jgi:hypothetical protein
VVGVYWVINDISRKEDSGGLDGRKALPFSYEILKSAILTPAYWLLMSLATYKALWQLLFKPSHWEKTEHGSYGDKYDSVGDL